jgi:hydroxymethylglutaryl-CoA lyase
MSLRHHRDARQAVTAEVVIRDVGPRDGLQSEAPVPPFRRQQLALDLARAGVRHIEAASFVSPKAVPSMAGADQVFAGIRGVDEPAVADVTWWALVPNVRGAELARAAGADSLTITVSASPGYSEKNVGMSTEQALATAADIATAVSDGVALDTVISCAFGSPFGDVPGTAAIADVVARVRDTVPGVVTLADTTGTATPRRIETVLRAVSDSADVDVLGLHLHDTRGTALANALAAMHFGVRRFDTSVGGLGGSPFAPGAGGNLATEDLVLVLEDEGVDTGIDLDALLAISRNLADLVGHDVPSRVCAAGRLARFDD